MLDESAFDRGVRLLATGQSEAALEQFKVSLAAADAEQRADSLYNIAICYIRLGRTDEAVRSLSDAVAVDPNIIADIANDGDFASLKTDAGFEQLLHRSHNQTLSTPSTEPSASSSGDQAPFRVNETVFAIAGGGVFFLLNLLTQGAVPGGAFGGAIGGALGFIVASIINSISKKN
jgi:tetratricopeptide (TPR) repeat protein